MPKMKTTDQFKKEIYEIFGDEYEVIGSYTGNKNKIEMKHNKCGKIYKTACPHDILVKHTTCPWCAGRITTLEALIEKLPSQFSYISEFKNWKTKCKFKCNKCNKEFFQAPSYITNGRGCPWCAGTKNYTHNEFIEILKEKYDDINEYEFLNEYKNTNTILSLKHDKCGCVSNIKAEWFMSGQRCKNCFTKNSTGEKFIENFLLVNNIKYEKEKQFFQFISKNSQPYKYDFYLENFNLIIEFDGEQHFKPWGKNIKNLKNLKNNIENDKIKNNFIIENNLKLLRIHYSELKNIKKILNNFLINGKRSETIENFKVLYINKILLFNNNDYYKEIKEVE